MPRAASKGRNQIDEDRLIDLIRSNPELYDENNDGANNSILKKNIWKNIAIDLDASVDICKKVWIKLKDNHGRETEPKGGKSNRRKSLRSCLTEKNLEFLNDISADNSNKNSRDSSNCSSPKDDEKRRLRSSTRSLSHLGSISETDLASLASSSTATIAPKEKVGGKSGSQSAGRTPRKLMNLDMELQENNSNERMLADGRYKNIPQPAERTLLRPRFSEPSHLASKEILKSEMNTTTPQRQSVSGSNNGRNGRMRKSPNPSDSTRTFFESMALTVSTFPQHLQAAMKVRICTIIAETEYDLSSPKVR